MPTNVVDQALSLPVDQVGNALASAPEDQWFERTSIRVAAKDFAIALVALANAEGGTVAVGLHGGQVEGVRSNTSQLNALRQAPIDLTDPPVRAHFDQVRCRNLRGDVDTILIARVAPGDVVHELTNGDCYLRMGDESRKLGFAQRQELHYDRGGSPYDGHPVSGTTIEDLDRNLLQAYRAAAGGTGSFSRLLKARSLLTPSDEVTVAGYLLFAPHPQDRFPQAHVRVLRFEDADRGTGRRLSLDDARDRRVEGPLPALIDEAARVIAAWVPARRVLDATGRFAPQPIVPRDAWLEGLVNAVIHRSYSVAGDHVRVEIYPDRIHIISPGRFPGLVDPERPLHVDRYARNPRIARVGADLRIGQELGEGIKRIFDEMRLRGLSDPVYTQTTGTVRLLLDSALRIGPDIEAALPRGALPLHDILRAAGQPLSTGQIIDLSHRSRPTVTKQLAALREAGLVEWQGQSAKDPRAAWTLPGR